MSRKPTKSPGKQEPETVAKSPPSAMTQVMDQAVLLFHRMKAAAAEVHREGDMTAALRGVLFGLHKHGPQTVPQMARARPVTRQHIQALVNKLLEMGLVELRDNPAHKRSHVVALTPAGARKIGRMLKRENELFSEYDLGISDAELLRTAEILERIRVGISSRRFRELLKKEP